MKRWLALAITGLVAAVGIFVFRSDEAGNTSPRGHAVKACDAARDFEDAVRRNDDIDTVKRHLQKARDEAGRAEKGDSLYVGLASGIEALHIAIETNDGQAADVGIKVVRDECGFVRRQGQDGS